MSPTPSIRGIRIRWMPSDANGASHLNNASPPPAGGIDGGTVDAAETGGEVDPLLAPPAHEKRIWSSEAERELLKIPFFVRGKARRNTEQYAAERQLATITLDTLYDAKAHHAR